MNDEQQHSTNWRALRDSNQAREQALNQQGIGIEPISALKDKLDIIGRHLMGDEYELQFHTKLDKDLGEIEAQVRKMRLQQGVAQQGHQLLGAPNMDRRPT